MTERLAKWTIALVILITIGATYQITTLRFDYEFEHFFPAEDPDLDFYFDFKYKFSTDVDFVLMALRNEKGVFDTTFLRKAQRLRNDLMTLEEVERVVSPFDPKAYIMGPFGPVPIPYIHLDQPDLIPSDSAKIYRNGLGVGSLFSTDAKSIAMVIEIEPDLSKVKTDTVYNKLVKVLEPYAFDDMHLAGKVIGQAYYIDQIKFEFALFFTLAVLLVVLILSLVYRSFWGVVVPLLIVLLSVIWLLGLMGLLGKPIDIMTALLPLIIFVVGVSDVIHLLSRYFEEIRNGHEKIKAIKIAYKQVGLATFLTSFTTALGFLTLLTSGIQPVRELGIYAASGVFVAFVLAFSLLPAVLILTKVPALAYKEPSNLFLNKLVRMVFFVSMRNQRVVLAITALVMALSLLFITQIKVDNYLLEDVGKDDPLRHSFEYFEEHFAGARPFEMYVTVKDSAETIFSMQALKDMEALEHYLTSTYGVGFIVSPLDIIRSANQALHGGMDSARALPPDEASLAILQRQIGQYSKRPEFKAIVTQDFKEARISGKLHDVGGLKAKQLGADLHSHFDAHPLEAIDYRLTGMALLIDKNNEVLSSNMMTGLFFALAVVGLIMGVLFKSLRMVVITLIPNILPLLVIGGVMGLFGIDLKVSTSIIFGIAFGIAVDDSIHYLSKYRLELAKGRDQVWALRRTSVSTGKSIILTSLILCAGFIMLSTSDFTSTFYVGSLISITLGVAVLADLFVLPVLINRWYARGRRKR
jgi:predicted RND superfamily exporter protein